MEALRCPLVIVSGPQQNPAHQPHESAFCGRYGGVCLTGIKIKHVHNCAFDVFLAMRERPVHRGPRLPHTRQAEETGIVPATISTVSARSE
jgi:hypothetical protein